MNEANKAPNQPEEGSSVTTIRVRVFGRTDVGLVREHNEDNFLVADLSTNNRSIKPEVREHHVGPLGTLFVVCDGMGGAAAGEVASQLGVDTIYDVMQAAEAQVTDEHLARLLVSAVREAGVRIFTAAKLNRRQRGMGTTVTSAVLNGQRLVLGQVGDSRAYVVRNGVITQVTKDQSLVQQLIDAKQITEEEARNFDRSNIILQALGTTEEVHVDITSVVLRRDDTLIMCSDGLSGLVSPDQILKVVQENDEPMEVCRILIEMARTNGGHDNITVVAARFDGVGLLPPAEQDVLSYNKFDYTGGLDTMAESLSVEKQEDSSIRAIGEAVEVEPREQLTPAPIPKHVPSTPPPVPAKPQNWHVLAAGALAGLIVGGGYIGYSFYQKRQVPHSTTIYRYNPETANSADDEPETEAAAPSTSQNSESDWAPQEAAATAGSPAVAVPHPTVTIPDDLPALAPTPENAISSPPPAPKPKVRDTATNPGRNMNDKPTAGSKKKGRSTDKPAKLPDNPF